MPRWLCRLFTELGAAALLYLQSLSPWLAIRSFRHGSEEWRTGRDCVSDASAMTRPISSSGQGGIACASLRPSQGGSRCSQFSDRRHGRLTAFKPVPPLRSGRGSHPSLSEWENKPYPQSTILYPRSTRNGGQGGIRTLGDVTATHAFQACSFDHSDTCPWEAGN